MQEQYLTVSQLTKYIKMKFDKDPYMERIFLTGEISNFNRNRRNSHQYFSLKDDQAKLSAVMFYGEYKKLKFQPEEGMSVLVIGRVSVYERTGAYQIYIEHMEPDGVGALYKAYEESKKRLAAEGIFDESLKKQLPKFPKRIGIITSQSGAVIRDIITTVKRRFPSVELVLFPTLVQGEKAAASIAENITRAEAKGHFDTLIVARGGGSFEDLWPFNEEIVVRAIVAAETPIISSVGHETDTTLSDLAADVRAATPTAAAELAVPVLSEELMKIEQQEHRLLRAYQTRLQALKERLNRIERSYIFRQPQRLYEGYSQNADQLHQQLLQVMKEKLMQANQESRLLSQRLKAVDPTQQIEQYRRDVDQLEKQLIRAQNQLIRQADKQLTYNIQSLEHLSPLKILGRGYAYVRKETQVIKSTDDLSASDKISVQLSDGSFTAEVVDIKQDKH
ncbi:exodeoxyribonuclease VII large subunit [Marinilactibacillus piezotolerans]|uniref:exodeoxyribonuclease VII large subunit n=1 Tax=Marinilactibacillus piezotolerans TaxID=258723 RepID=UPI0009B02CA2|nr:exodeoxyribonuclease VII large subunit [Marinilactibacillus piezotolerans]